MRTHHRGGKKRQAQFKHFRSRLHERYGLELTRTEYEALCLQVRASRGDDLLQRQSRRISIRLLAVCGRPVPVVYDHLRLSLVSALPVGAEAEFLPAGSGRPPRLDGVQGRDSL